MKKHTQNKCLVVAEISANHGQSFSRAIKLIRQAKKCGVDAVKFQAYTPDTLTIDVDNKYFRIKHPKWGGQTLYSLYKKAYTPWKWFKRLKRTAEDLGLLFFSTAFDQSSVDFLEELGVPLHKISSFELVDIPLIEYAAKTGKPLILSTGMATLQEIKDAVSAARKAGASDITLLKCTSAYPAAPAEMHLRTIQDMMKKFHTPVGLSDHTLGTEIPIAAVVLGACLIEKHFILSRLTHTPDSFFSLEPIELKRLVQEIRNVESALGTVFYGAGKSEQSSLAFRRSLFAVRDIVRGAIFTEVNIRSIRPAQGLSPKYMRKISGKRARRDVMRGTPLDWSMIL